MNEIKLEQKKPVRIRLPKSKKALIGVVVGVMLLALVFGGWLALSNKSDDTKTTAVCSESILEESAKKISSNKSAELADVSDKITQLPNFDKDVNCLYIVTSYYIGVGDSANSRKYYNKLQVIYEPNTGYGPALGETTLNPDVLKENINFLEKQQQEIKTNIFYGPEV